MSPQGPEKIIIPLFPLIFILAGLVTLFLAYRFARSPLQRRISVVDERTKVQSTDERTTTRYFCTLQFEDGVRVEMSTKGRVAGMVTRGDIGVAYSKLDKLVDFKRVDVQDSLSADIRVSSISLDTKKPTQVDRLVRARWRLTCC